MARGRGCLDWYIYGEWDTERYIAKLRDYCPLVAGALFGAAWWVLADAIVYAKSVLGGDVPWTYFLPGIAATFALIFMNLVSREELLEINDQSAEEGAAMRARCWLFFSYMVAFGAIAGAVAVLIKGSQSGDSSKQHMGIAALVETFFIICSGLLLWSFRTPSESDYYY